MQATAWPTTYNADLRVVLEDMLRHKGTKDAPGVTFGTADVGETGGDPVLMMTVLVERADCPEPLDQDSFAFDDAVSMFVINAVNVAVTRAAEAARTGPVQKVTAAVGLRGGALVATMRVE